MPARRRARAPAGDPRERLIAAALDLAAKNGWRRTSMAAIADAADLSLAETYALFRSKFAILAAFRRSIDEAVLARSAPSASDSPRDRIFDVLMRRLEALKPYREGLAVIARESIGSPLLAKALPGYARSMGWMLEAAGIPASGCRGRVACKVLCIIYISVLPVFLRDESADLGTTMAALDRRLRQAESLFSTLQPIASRMRKSRN